MKHAIRLLLVVLVLLPVRSMALDVLVNQVGFVPGAPKIVRGQRATDYAGDGTFSVKRVSDNAQVYSGTLTRKGGLWNKFYWEGDFGSFTTPGSYYINANVDGENASSYNFTIGANVLLDKTGKLVYQYFTAQRCGAAVSLQYVNRSGNLVTWTHNSCHTDDAYTNPSGPHIDGVGGWHDAGDYGKYGHGFAGNPVFDLLWLYDSDRGYFDAIDANANGIADIVDEALWQARWLVKIVQANGHVMNTFHQRRSGPSWVKPESDTDRVVGNSDDRWVDVGNEVTPQETVVCAALARMHRVLASKGLPTENFAAKALSIWDHRVALAIAEGGHNNLGSAFHNMFSGLDLYAIYGQQDCWDRAVLTVNELANSVNNNPAIYDEMMGGDYPGYNLGAMAWFARNYPNEAVSTQARTATQALMNHYMNYLAGPQIGLMRRVEGGNFQYFPANPSLGLNMLYGFVTWGAIEAYKTIGDASYLRFAENQFDWILGANYHRVCMMEAAGSYHLNKYHSRYDTFITNGIEPGVVTNGYIRDGSGLPWVDFGTGSVSVQTNEGWLPNSSAYAMALAAMNVFRDAARVTINNNSFAYGSDGWITSTWRAGSGGFGTMAWDPTAGAQGGAMRSTGDGITDSTDTCIREGGEIRKVIRTAGYENIKVSYDLRVNALGASYTGLGSNGCSVDHSLIDEQLTVYYSIDGGTNWTEAEWVRRSDLLASYTNYGTRTVDLSFAEGVSNNPSFALRFRWQGNTASDVFDLDNIVVTGTVNGLPDTIAPGAVTGFGAIVGDQQVTLVWTNPSDADFAGTKILFKTTGYPTSATDGTVVCDKLNGPSTSDTYVHTGLTNGLTYYYAAFARDEAGNYSSSATTTAAPYHLNPVTNFVGVDATTQISLSWTNPTFPQFAGTRIVFKTTGLPASPIDGTLLYSGAGTSCAHTGLAGGTTYYYAAYAFDGVPNYSQAATRSVVHVSPYCFADSIACPNGNLNGNLGWSGTATSQVLVEDQTAKICGGAGVYDAVRAVGCAYSPLAVRVRMKKGSGSSTIWNMYLLDSSGGDLGKWYGSGTSGRGRIGAGTPTGVGTFTGGWDELYTKLDFSANTTQFVFNGVSLGAPTHTGGDAIGSIKIERPDSASATGQYVNLDDITIGPVDATPPSASVGAPSLSVTKSGPVSFTVNFNEPVYGFSAASDVQVNTTGTAAGTVAVSGSGPYTVTLSNITGGGTLGITVKASACTDVAANGNTVSSASALVTVVASDGSIASAKQLVNGSHVELCGKALYLDGVSYGYIEELSRSAGIRIQGSIAASEGDLVCLSGTMHTSAAGEKYIQIDGIAAAGQGTVRAVGCTNRAVKSGLMNGLRVKTWGVVKPGSITGNSYVITDGSDDVGVKVITVGAPGVSANQFVTISGAAGFDGARVVFAD